MNIDSTLLFYIIIPNPNLLLQLRSQLLVSRSSSLRLRREYPVRNTKDTKDKDVACEHTTNK